MRTFVALTILAIIIGLFTSSAMAVKIENQQHLAHGNKIRKSNPFIDVIQSIFGNIPSDGGDDEEEEEGEEEDEPRVYEYIFGDEFPGGDIGDKGENLYEEYAPAKDYSLRKAIRTKANMIKSAQSFKTKMIKAVHKVNVEHSSPFAEGFNDCITNYTLVYTEPCDYVQQCMNAVDYCLPYAGDLAPLIADEFCSVRDAYVKQNCNLIIPFCNNGTNVELMISS